MKGKAMLVSEMVLRISLVCLPLLVAYFSAFRARRSRSCNLFAYGLICLVSLLILSVVAPQLLFAQTVALDYVVLSLAILPLWGATVLFCGLTRRSAFYARVPRRRLFPMFGMV